MPEKIGPTDNKIETFLVESEQKIPKIKKWLLCVWHWALLKLYRKKKKLLTEEELIDLLKIIFENKSEFYNEIQNRNQKRYQKRMESCNPIINKRVKRSEKIPPFKDSVEKSAEPMHESSFEKPSWMKE